MRTQLRIVIAKENLGYSERLYELFNEAAPWCQIEIVEEKKLHEHICTNGVLTHLVLLFTHSNLCYYRWHLPLLTKFQNLNKMAVAVYDLNPSEEQALKAFTHGANAYLEHKEDPFGMKTALQKVIRTTAIYQFEPMNMRNMLLKV